MVALRPATVFLAFLSCVLTPPAAASHPCDRYALDGLALGMSRDTVKTTMGGDGLGTRIRLPDGGESTAVSYPGPPHDIYVEYDQPIERRKARVARLRVSMPLSKDSIDTLLRRFGQPNAGVDDLKDGLHDGGTAVWIDETCGLVLTAFRPTASWWAADGGTHLQVETFDLAQRADSPAKSRLKPTSAPEGPRIASPPAARLPAPAPVTLQDDLAWPEPTVVAEASPQPVVAAVLTAPEPSAPARPEPVLVPVETPRPRPATIATWHATDPPAPSSTPPPVPATPKTSNLPRTPATGPPRTDAPPERIRYVEPVYPSTAKWLGVKGRVTLAITVMPDGTVARPVALVRARPSGRGFEDAAIAAVRQWRFAPATRGGRPVESKLTVEVDFQEATR